MIDHVTAETDDYDADDVDNDGHYFADFHVAEFDAMLQQLL